MIDFERLVELGHLLWRMQSELQHVTGNAEATNLGLGWAPALFEGQSLLLCNEQVSQSPGVARQLGEEGTWNVRAERQKTYRTRS
jgi:hypothetical protein